MSKLPTRSLPDFFLEVYLTLASVIFLGGGLHLKMTSNIENKTFGFIVNSFKAIRTCIFICSSTTTTNRAKITYLLRSLVQQQLICASRSENYFLGVDLDSGRAFLYAQFVHMFLLFTTRALTVKDKIKTTSKHFRFMVNFVLIVL